MVSTNVGKPHAFSKSILPKVLLAHYLQQVNNYSVRSYTSDLYRHASWTDERQCEAAGGKLRLDGLDQSRLGTEMMEV